MQIRTRLTLRFITVVAVILLISFLAVYYSSSHYSYHEFNTRLKEKAITTADILVKVNEVDSSLLSVIDKTQRDKLVRQQVVIFDEENREVFRNVDSVFVPVHPRNISEVRVKGQLEFTYRQFEVVGISYKEEGKDLVVFASAEDRYGQSKLRNLRTTLVLSFLVILGVVSVAGWIYSGQALRPISQVIDEVDQISATKLSTRIRERENDDEIGRLIKTFNKLLQRIEDAFRLQRLFVASASHELKNPLTVITSQLQVSLISERDSESYRNTIESVLEDIIDLNRLTIQLMELARVSYDVRDIEFLPIRIDEVLWSVKNTWTEKHPEDFFDFYITSLPEDDKDLLIHGNESLLRTAFVNLAENACKFSPDHRVEVVLDCTPDRIMVTFNDSGPGISPDELKYIFEPFYRSKSAAGTRGHGIGLALVKRILDLHQAELSVRRSESGGASFNIRFNLPNSNL